MKLRILIFLEIIKLSTCFKCESGPLIEFSDQCDVPGVLTTFKVYSTKKINYKKPLNGNLKVKFEDEANDAIKMKKCINIWPTFSKTLTIATKFKNNIPTGITTLEDISYFYEVNLNDHGIVKGVVKRCKKPIEIKSKENDDYLKDICFEDKLDKLFSCDFPNVVWQFFSVYQYWSTRNNGFEVITTNFNEFHSCKKIFGTIASQCSAPSEVNSLNGFFTVEVDENPKEVYDLNLISGETVKQSEVEAFKQKMCLESSKSISSWVRFIEQWNHTDTKVSILIF